MEDCIDLANELGKKVGRYGIPVYLYGTAARTEERISQADIRKGQYEGLEEKLKQPYSVQQSKELNNSPKSNNKPIQMQKYASYNDYKYVWYNI